MTIFITSQMLATVYNLWAGGAGGFWGRGRLFCTRGKRGATKFVPHVEGGPSILYFKSVLHILPKIVHLPINQWCIFKIFAATQHFSISYIWYTTQQSSIHMVIFEVSCQGNCLWMAWGGINFVPGFGGGGYVFCTAPSRGAAIFAWPILAKFSSPPADKLWMVP